MACAGHAHIEVEVGWFHRGCPAGIACAKNTSHSQQESKALTTRAQERQAPSERRSFERNVRTRIQAVASERSSRALLLKLNALKLFTLPELRLSF